MHRIRNITLAVSAAFLSVAAAGCEEAPTWDELTGGGEVRNTPVAAPEMETRPLEPRAPRESGRTPEAIIGAFLALRPVNITDQHLLELTALESGLEAVTELDLERSQVTRDGLEQIGRLTSLVRLNLSGMEVDDDVLAQLTEMPDLQALYLSHCPLNDALLERIAPLVTLRELGLKQTGISDNGFEHFRNLTLLELLDVSSCSIDGSGFRVFSRMGDNCRLKTIIVHYTGFGTYGPKHIDGCEQLEVLSASQAGLTDAGLGELKNCRNLRELDASFNAVSDRGMKRLSKLPNVEVLKLVKNPAISNATLATVKDWQSLTSLEIDGTSCNLGGVMELKKYLPNVTIRWNGQRY